MGNWDLSDIYALALRPVALGLGHIYQANPSCPCYNYYISLKIKLYADDILIYNTINSDADCRNLQIDLNTSQDSALTWQMHFNPSKCKILRVTDRKKIIEFQYCIQSKK